MSLPVPSPVKVCHQDTYAAIDPRRPLLSQSGKTIVVTGAGSGIGQETIDAFAQAGSKTIHIIGRNKQKLEQIKQAVNKKHPGVQISIHVADVSDVDAVQAATETIGFWDVLVQAHGYGHSPALIKDSDINDWWRTFEIQTKGAYILSRAFLQTKKAGGTIISLGTAASILPPTTPFLLKESAHIASKLATARLFEMLAVENEDLNVYNMHPGVVRTELYNKLELPLDEILDELSLPAHFAVWLASPGAQPFKGRFLLANWDVEELLSSVAPRVKSDPVFLTTSLGGFPF